MVAVRGVVYAGDENREERQGRACAGKRSNNIAGTVRDDVADPVPRALFYTAPDDKGRPAHSSERRPETASSVVADARFVVGGEGVANVVKTSAAPVTRSQSMILRYHVIIPRGATPTLMRNII